MYGKVPRVTAPSWIGGLHRWSGRIAFLLAVPVAVHCLYALGFQSYSTRVLIHSVLGCAFFGAFTVKMLILPKNGLPGWVLPVAGAVVFVGAGRPVVHVRLLVLFHLRHQALRSPRHGRAQRPRIQPAHRAGLRRRRVRRRAGRMQPATTPTTAG